MTDKIYKAETQIKTGEFEYIKIHVEDTVAGIIEAHRGLQAGWKTTDGGLEKKEWCDALDKYRQGKGLAPDLWEKMNAAQKWLLGELDRSDNRIKPKIPAKKRVVENDKEKYEGLDPKDL